ncbi:hypothetical protein [Aeromicrobium sp.]|uniref:sulfurtransferase TusA family protein n=1 Tax=Aeromicrobium sp. TaxID=1871063 RepID=UPI0030C23ED9
MELIDGGDRSCGDLLLVLAARSRALGRGTIRLLANDPAAAIDLPAWCHLTGHSYLGRGVNAQGRPYFDVRLSNVARTTDHTQPWRLDPEPPRSHHREEHV